MKRAALISCLACLTGCVTNVALNPTLPLASPSTINADPDRYDQKQIYVRGILATGGHWWQFNFYENDRQYVGNFCLNLEHLGWLSAHRAAMNHKHVILKGKFAKGAWKDALGGCDGNPNGLFIDEEVLKQRYGHLAEAPR